MVSNFVAKLPRFVFICLIMIAIAFQARKHVVPVTEAKTASFTENNPMRDRESAISLADVQKVYPSAISVKNLDSLQHQVFDVQDKQIGTILHSECTAPKVVGFGGATPLCVFLDSVQRILKVELLANAETPSYLDYLKKNKYLEQWNGKSVEEALRMQTDALSGCTYTSTAVKENMHLCLEAYTQSSVDISDNTYLYLRNGIALLVVLLGFLSFLYPAKFGKYRIILLALSFIVLGTWQAKTLSLALFYGFLSHGLTWTMWFVIGMLFISIIISLFTNKAFYCTYICPYGAAQELAGKIRKRKWRIPRRIGVYFGNIREQIILICMFLALTQIVTDFSQVEVFSAFSFTTATVFVQILFGFFLLLSVFIPKPWCRFFCPTGFLLELMRKPGK